MSLLKIEPDAGIFLGPELKPKISTESPPTNMFGSDAQKWITSM